RHMKCSDPAIGGSGDVELAILDFVIRENGFQKLRKDARTVFEKQLVIRRGWSNHDVTALLGLRTEVAIENAIHGVHCLRATAKSTDAGIRLQRIVHIRKHDLIPN